MTDQNELRTAYREALRYKYAIIIIVLIFVLVTIFFRSSTNLVFLDLIVTTILASSITAGMISLLYDFFLFKQQSALSKIDREKFVDELIHSLFRERAQSILTKEDVRNIILKTPHKDSIAAALAESIADDPQIQAHIQKSYFYPFSTKPKFKNIRASHIFKKKDNISYLWNCRHQVTCIEEVFSFRLIICSDNILAAKIAGSFGITDFLILLSDDDGHDLSTWSSDKLKLDFSCIRDGERVSIPLKIKDSTKKFMRENKILTDERDGKYLLIEAASKECEGAVFNMGFQQELSFSDGYFCWTCDEYSFVDSVKVDYLDVKNNFGIPSIINYIGSQVADVIHRKDDGIIEFRINDLVRPGDGFVVVMRGNNDVVS